MAEQKRVGIVPPLVKDEAKAAQIMKQLQASKDAPTVIKPRKEGEKSEAKKQQESEAKPVVQTTPKKRSSTVPGIKLPKKKKQAPVRRTSTWVGKKVGKRAGAIEKGEDGTLRRVTKEEARASITTVLPAQERPSTPPRAKMRTQVATGRGVVNPSNRGFARNPAQVGELLKQAIGHLESMKNTHGTPEFHGHHDAFNQVHATLGVDRGVHQMLGIARNAVLNPTHPKSASHFDLSMKALRSKLSQGTRVATQNVENARAGQARARAARIAAQKEGNA